MKKLLKLIMDFNEFKVHGHTVKLSKFKDLSFRNKSTFIIKSNMSKNNIILRKKIQRYLEDEGLIDNNI